MFPKIARQLTLLCCLLIVIVSLLVPSTAHAAQDFNITTSPLPLDLTTRPGVPVSTPLRVQNSGTAPVKIKVSVLKFKASGETGQPQLASPQPTDAFISWVTFSKTSFLALPGQWNEITMTISPPKEAAFGYYYAVVFSQDTADIPNVPNANRLTGAAATLVLLNVQAPGEKRSLDLKAFTISKKLFEYLPVSFSVTTQNNGNVHVIPAGSIYISQGNKKDIAVLSVNPNQGNVLPASTRTFTVLWDNGFPVFDQKRVNGQVITDAQGQPVRQLRWDVRNISSLRFGKYKAHLLLTYNDGAKDVPLEAEVSFWVIPWKILPLLVLLMALIGVGIWTVGKTVFQKLRRRRGHRH